MTRLILAALAVMLVSGAEADEQPIGCYPSIKEAIQHVADKYQEKPQAVFRSFFNGLVVLMTANLKTGTWTMFAAKGPNEFCMINIGDSFGEPSDKMKELGAPGMDM